MSVIQIAAVSVLVVSVFAVGFVLGKFYERVQWNKLIQNGIIPTPR